MFWCRETQRIGYESRIQQEMEQFHSRTNLGMEQLRLQTREMFERENRSVKFILMILIIIILGAYKRLVMQP